MRYVLLAMVIAASAAHAGYAEDAAAQRAGQQLTDIDKYQREKAQQALERRLVDPPKERDSPVPVLALGVGILAAWAWISLRNRK